MTQTNVDIVRQGYSRPSLLIDPLHVARDAEFDFSDLYPDQPVLRGMEEMRAFQDAGPWGGSIHFEPERYLDVDEERVLVLVRVAATGEGSGAPVEIRVAHEFTLRDGLIVRFKVHSDPADALEAAGLTE
jgi:ketosteroid isomerase-like protein